MPNNPLTVLFHSHSLTVRGTEVALFDYGDFNESLLGNISVMVFPSQGVESEAARQKFEGRFKTYFYDSPEELASIAERCGADVCYFIKKGQNDGLLVPDRKNAIHVVFQHLDPHGDIYAYVSEWLSKTAGEGAYSFVPHIIRHPVNTGDDMRVELGIPETADVYGVIGGVDSFKILSATNAVLDAIEKNPSKVFLFVNTRMPEWFTWTRRRIRKALESGRLKYLEQITDFDAKERFINTCDAMLHARRRGETFGIALGEFDVRGKPLLVHFSRRTRDRGHYDILGDSPNYYRSKAEIDKLLSANPRSLKVSGRYRQFFPETVMPIFDKVFLKDS
jgi:hypothetical protein